VSKIARRRNGTNQRGQLILEQLLRTGSLTIEELCQRFGISVATARRDLEQLEKQAEAAAWEGLNKKDVNALKAYLAQHLSSPYRGEAEKALGQLAATDRTKRDQEEIGQALARYAHAIEAKDATAIQSIWPGISAGTLKDLRDTFKASSSLSMELTPSSIQVTGDSAVAACSRRIIQESHGRRESSGNVSVRLRRTDHGWVIDSMQ